MAEVREDPQYGLRVHELSGKRLLCHCRVTEKCHADNLRDLFRDWHPHAFDPSSAARPPLSTELNILVKAREDREDSEESGLEDAEAEAPQGWPGTGKPMVIGSGYVERRLCDGQGLCSPGACARGDRCYPSSQIWTSLSRLFLATAESISSFQLLSELALGRHARSPFGQDVVKRLRDDVKVILARESILFERVEGDRTDVPIDFRLLGGLLKAAVSIAPFAQGVRVGPGSRMPRCPKLYTKKKKWRIPEQREQVDVDEVLATQGVWNKNYSTLSSFRAEVEDVLRDHAGRGQVLILPEAEARNRFPNLVVASTSAQKKEKPGGVVSARVLFDGTNGNFANTSTHLRDQERAPVAPDLKRLMREKAKTGEVTFGLTADVKEAHRHVPIHPDDWHLLGCQLERGCEVFVNTVGNVRGLLGFLQLEPCLCRSGKTDTIPHLLVCHQVDHASRRRLSRRGWWTALQACSPGFLLAVRGSRLPTLVEQDERRDSDQLGRLRAPSEGTRPGTDGTKSSMGCEVGSRNSGRQGDPRPCVRGGAGKVGVRDQCAGAPPSLLGTPVRLCDVGSARLGEASSCLRLFLPEVSGRGC